MLRSTELYIDLGTANTLIYVHRRGFVLNEPSVLTLKTIPSHKEEVFALGSSAKIMLGKTPSQYQVLRPLKEGVIADFDHTAQLLLGFLKRVKEGTTWIRPSIVISLPCKVTPSERDAVKEIAFLVGAKSVSLIEEPVAAAIGAGLPIMQPQGNIVVDIGGGTTEIAITSCGGIVYANAVRVGGDHMDERITHFLRYKYNFLIGEQTAERLKVHLAQAAPSKKIRSMEAGGLNLTTGLPARMRFSSDDIAHAIKEPLNQIIRAIKVALENTPGEIAGDIAQTGITLAGGGALIQGLAERVEQETGVFVKIAPTPLLSIAFGGAKVLEDQELLERVAI